jgi:hypothetical protein
MCVHGVTIGGGVTGPCFGRICTCRCCSSRYVLVNSSTYNAQDGLISSRTRPEDICRACGGVPVEYLHPAYEEERVEHENGFVVTRLRRKQP